VTATLIATAAMISEAVLLGTAEALERAAGRLRDLHESNPAVMAWRRHRAAQVDRAARGVTTPAGMEDGGS
jgi:hypothetical protein